MHRAILLLVATLAMVVYSQRKKLTMATVGALANAELKLQQKLMDFRDHHLLM